MSDLVTEKYLTINGKKRKWKKVYGSPLQQEQFNNPDKSLMDIMCGKGMDEIDKLVIDADGNAYRAESKEHADEVQKKIDIEATGFKMIG